MASLPGSLSVRTLPRPLHLIKLDHGDEQWGVAVLRLALFARPQFFSFTRQEEEVSLVVDADAVATLPSGLVEGNTPWGALLVEEGEDVIDMSGVVSEMSSTLARHHIPTFYLSTYATDLLLVPPAHLTQAHTLLQARLQSPSLAPSAPLPSSPSLTLKRLDNTLRICEIPVPSVPACAHAIVRALLFPASPAVFFSLTMTQSEVTVVCDEEVMGWFPPDTLRVHSAAWCALRISEGATPIDALVWLVSRSLAHRSIPIYYLGTFSVDLALVPTDRLSLAVAALRDDFSVVE